MPTASPATGCVFSWGGSEAARGWRGPSTSGSGPAHVVTTDELSYTTRTAILAHRVAASRNSLALLSDGRVLTWGLNDSRGGGDAWFVRGGRSSSIPDSGQLGRWVTMSNRRHASAPGIVTLGPLAAEGALSIASGRYHALAIGRISRAVHSWGLNDHGQLGRSAWVGGRRPRGPPRKPCESGSRCRDVVALPVADGPTPAVAISAGRYFSLAIGVNGRAYAWGRCACGQPVASMEGTPLGSGRPYAISGGGIEQERLVAAATGYTHLMLLAESGALYTCESGDDGYGGRLQTAPAPNFYGQLGRPGPPLTPMRVAPSSLGASAPSLIAAGRCASFVADARGEVYAWGCAQGSGHRPPDRSTPALLDALRGQTVYALSAGEYHAVAALGAPATSAGGTAAAADARSATPDSSGASEQLRLAVWGAGTGSNYVRVTGLPNKARVLALSAGYQHNVAILSECDSEGALGVSVEIR